MASKPTVIVGMSGGVDSSVAAALLQQQGYRVIGVFLKNWTHEDGVVQACPWEVDYRDMRAVCQQLNIPYYTFNFEQEYRDTVFRYFLEEYKAGRTPNPDVMCNTEIKFKVFLERAQELQADFVATGHYARVRRWGGKFQLLKGRDSNKDQSYFIHHLSQQQLGRILFPIGHLPKPQVRALAKQFNLPVFDKPDSQGICFIGKIDFRTFLGQYIPKTPGNIMTVEGKKVGQHTGLAFYTNGQREGIGIGGTGPYFVVTKDIKTNTLIVAQGDHHPSLFAEGLLASNMHWVNGRPPRFPLGIRAKIRYRQPDQACRIQRMNDNQWQIRFSHSQRAVTPGQFVVLYRGAQCLGGGAIQCAL